MSRAGLRAALRSLLLFAGRLLARLSRRAWSAKALARVTSYGGRIARLEGASCGHPWS